VLPHCVPEFVLVELSPPLVEESPEFLVGLPLGPESLHEALRFDEIFDL
jgi:hypothetical protein